MRTFHRTGLLAAALTAIVVAGITPARAVDFFTIDSAQSQVTVTGLVRFVDYGTTVPILSQGSVGLGTPGSSNGDAFSWFGELVVDFHPSGTSLSILNWSVLASQVSGSWYPGTTFPLVDEPASMGLFYDVEPATGIPGAVAFAVRDIGARLTPVSNLPLTPAGAGTATFPRPTTLEPTAGTYASWGLTGEGWRFDYEPVDLGLIESLTNTPGAGTFTTPPSGPRSIQIPLDLYLDEDLLFGDPLFGDVEIELHFGGQIVATEDLARIGPLNGNFEADEISSVRDHVITNWNTVSTPNNNFVGIQRHPDELQARPNGSHNVAFMNVRGDTAAMFQAVVPAGEVEEVGLYEVLFDLGNRDLGNQAVDATASVVAYFTTGTDDSDISQRLGPIFELPSLASIGEGQWLLDQKLLLPASAIPNNGESLNLVFRSMSTNSGAVAQVMFDNIRISLREFQPGDVNGDGWVDVFDVGVVSENWLQSGPLGIAGDANIDGAVNIFDVGTISEHWMPQGAASVPEPSAIAIAALGALVSVAAAVFRRRWSL